MALLHLLLLIHNLNSLAGQSNYTSKYSNSQTHFSNTKLIINTFPLTPKSTLLFSSLSLKKSNKLHHKLSNRYTQWPRNHVLQTLRVYTTIQTKQIKTTKHRKTRMKLLVKLVLLNHHQVQWRRKNQPQHFLCH